MKNILKTFPFRLFSKRKKKERRKKVIKISSKPTMRCGQNGLIEIHITKTNQNKNIFEFFRLRGLIRLTTIWSVAILCSSSRWWPMCGSSVSGREERSHWGCDEIWFQTAMKRNPCNVFAVTEPTRSKQTQKANRAISLRFTSDLWILKCDFRANDDSYRLVAHDVWANGPASGRNARACNLAQTTLHPKHHA